MSVTATRREVSLKNKLNRSNPLQLCVDSRAQSDNRSQLRFVKLQVLPSEKN